MDYPRYDPHSAVTPLTALELEGLDRLLQSLDADGVMTLDGVDGYLTALLVAPEPLLLQVPTPDWLPIVWGGDGEHGAAQAAPFASKRQKKATVVLLLRHLRHLSDQLTSTPQAWEPIFSVAEQGPEEWADASDWCAGFLQAIDLWPSVWDGALADQGLRAALAPLVLLGGGLEGRPADEDADPLEKHDTEADPPEDPLARDRLSRAVPDAVLLLQARASGTPQPGAST